VAHHVHHGADQVRDAALPREGEDRDRHQSHHDDEGRDGRCREHPPLPRETRARDSGDHQQSEVRGRHRHERGDPSSCVENHRHDWDGYRPSAWGGPVGRFRLEKFHPTRHRDVERRTNQRGDEDGQRR